MSKDDKINSSTDKKSSSSVLIKVSWAIVIGLSIFGLGFYVFDCYKKFKITPEILVNERYIHRHEVPFPAITICPPIVVNTKMINTTKFNEFGIQRIAPSQEEQATMASLGQICGKYHSQVERNQGTKIFTENVVETLNKAALHINETFDWCFFGDGCEKILVRSLTYIGYCFTFNMLDHELIFSEDISSDFDAYKYENVKNPTTKWTLDRRYLTDEKLVKPLKSTEVESIQFNAAIKKSEIENFCTEREGAFQVILHLPNEIPSYMNMMTSFEFDKQKILRITASVKSLDESLNGFPVELRKCYFDDERQLRFFKIYTLNNCIQECIGNFTRAYCGCAFFASPRTNDMNVCAFKDMDCVDNVYNKWPSIYYENPENKENFKDFPCNCMPTCTDIKYNIESENTYEWRKLNTNDSVVGKIHIRFTFGHIVETTNYVTYQLENFICDIGGLAGLFLGFSLLTIFEITLKTLNFINSKVSKGVQDRKFLGQNNFTEVKKYSDREKRRGVRTVYVLPYQT